MNGIGTTYFGATNTRGSYIKAYTLGDRPVAIHVPYPHQEHEGEAAHWFAARTLALKLGWTGTMVGASVKGSKCVFVPVFAPRNIDGSYAPEYGYMRAALESIHAAVAPLCAGKRGGGTMGNISSADDLVIASLTE
jgi:hypothetical protein